MNIKARLAKLEASIPTLQEKRFVFMTRADFDDAEIIGFKYEESKILRAIDDTFDDFKKKGALFFAENYLEITVFIVQSLYMADTN